MAFDYSQFRKLFSLDDYRYKYANMNNDDSYRKGLLDAARGQISVFDKDNSEDWNLDEFTTKEVTGIARMQYEYDGINVDNLDENGQKEFNSLVEQLKQQCKEACEDSFNVLDLNSDGKVDYQEIAAETALADKMDGTSSDRDGIVGSEGYASIYDESQSPESNKAKLKDIFKELNLGNLGKKGDINFDNVTEVKKDTKAEVNPNSEIQQLLREIENLKSESSDSNQTSFQSIIQKLLPAIIIAFLANFFINKQTA